MELSLVLDSGRKRKDLIFYPPLRDGFGSYRAGSLGFIPSRAAFWSPVLKNPKFLCAVGPSRALSEFVSIYKEGSQNFLIKQSPFFSSWETHQQLKSLLRWCAWHFLASWCELGGKSCQVAWDALTEAPGKLEICCQGPPWHS